MAVIGGVFKAISPRFSIDLLGAKKVVKGAGVGGLGAMAIVFLVKMGWLPDKMLDPDVIAFLTVLAGVAVNFVRQILARYE